MHGEKRSTALDARRRRSWEIDPRQPDDASSSSRRPVDRRDDIALRCTVTRKLKKMQQLARATSQHALCTESAHSRAKTTAPLRPRGIRPRTYEATLARRGPAAGHDPSGNGRRRRRRRRFVAAFHARNTIARSPGLWPCGWVGVRETDAPCMPHARLRRPLLFFSPVDRERAASSFHACLHAHVRARQQPRMHACARLSARACACACLRCVYTYYSPTCWCVCTVHRSLPSPATAKRCLPRLWPWGPHASGPA